MEAVTGMGDREYAIEADPGRLTASFPTFPSLEAAIAAASVPAFYRENVAPPRVLVRERSPWRDTGHRGDPRA